MERRKIRGKAKGRAVRGELRGNIKRAVYIRGGERQEIQERLGERGRAKSRREKGRGK